MATAPVSLPGAGGKMVTNRRRQRLAATPYDRPPPPPPPPAPKSPNWFTGVIIPSARALASGAGKILSSAVFSDAESSSSEDVDSAPEDDADNANDYESPYDGVNALNEEKVTSLEMMQHGREAQLSVRRTETKRLIEQLIMQENFSREECDRLIKVLNSRVMDWSVEAGEKRSLANSPAQTVDHENTDLSNKAVLEAKKWFQEKKVGSSSVAELARGTCNLNSTAFDHIESGVGSPVDVARSYMRDRPPWASPTKHFELGTPLTTTMKLFKEGTPYSVNHDVLSASKRQNSLASGSWNIQEELRKVRSKAIEDMLRTSPSKIDSSLFAVATKEEFAGAGKVVSGVEERMPELHSSQETMPLDTLMDVGVSSDPPLVALGSRQDGEPNEAPSSNPDASVSGNNEDSEAIQIDGECAPSKFPYPTTPNHAEEQHSDPHSAKLSEPPETEVAESGGRLHINGFSSAQASLSPGEAIVQKYKQHDEANHNDHTVSENRPTNIINVEGNCELLSEAYMDVPIVTETDSIASGSQISLGLQYEESPLEITQPSTEGKPNLMTGKQQGRKPSKNSRRGRGRGK